MRTIPPTDSLVELAARKQLPRHQYMDDTTVAWIRANRPDVPSVAPSRLSPLAQRCLAAAAIPAEWFADQRRVDSLHGIRHAMRTAAFAALLAEHARLEPQDTATLIMAAAIHDCRRLHDKDDVGHGARATQWLHHHPKTVLDHFGLEHVAGRISQVSTAVHLHETPYAEFTALDESRYSDAVVITDILKAADALDRYRLPKLKWWPDPALIRASAFEQLLGTAFDLVVQTEAAHVAGEGSAHAVLSAFDRQEWFR